MRRAALLLPLLALSAPSSAQGDPAVVDEVIRIGKEHGLVWSTLEYLSYEIGPRLTGSTSLQRANEWTAARFRDYGLENVELREWGTTGVRFDRGPSWGKMVEPIEMPMEITAPSWSAGTEGPLRGPVRVRPATLAELEADPERFVGAWVLERPRPRQWQQPEEARLEQEQVAARLEEIGIAGRLLGQREDLVRTRSYPGWREMTMETLPTDVQVVIRRRDYDMLNSRLADGEDVQVEVDLQHTFSPGPIPLYNTIAEIPGTELPEEVVIVSAHLDSWDGPGSMGTQDNGTGTSVTLEAARLLMEAGAKPKRTLRFILWTGEEQGLLGSRAYVESLSEEEKARISACFVDDGGTNYEGGLVCIESMLPMLEEATAPVRAAFPQHPMEHTVRESMPRGGGSDHASFNRAGIPGFFWKETGSGGREGKTYRFIHHTQHDTPRYAVEDYLIQSAVSAAVTSYNLACADTLLPRQPSEEEAAPVEAGSGGGAR